MSSCRLACHLVGKDGLLAAEPFRVEVLVPLFPFQVVVIFPPFLLLLWGSWMVVLALNDCRFFYSSLQRVLNLGVDGIGFLCLFPG